ncbi:MAG: SoxR reducing system RseC family protein [Alistipes sp.]|nr:SoxR reducing system RseC family protein [Alistipes sp.]MBR5811689.1 SoxR reducing system RseC family protein [Alistipes sp.]
MAATPIKHAGEVIGVEGNKVIVRMVVNSACSGCHAKAVCGVDESKDKIVEVVTLAASEYAVGDSVEVALRHKSMGVMSVLLAYVIPFFVLSLLLYGVSALGGSDEMAALSALAGVGLYYIGLWLVRDKVRNKIEFTITKQTK